MFPILTVCNSGFLPQQSQAHEVRSVCLNQTPWPGFSISLAQLEVITLPVRHLDAPYDGKPFPSRLTSQFLTEGIGTIHEHTDGVGNN